MAQSEFRVAISPRNFDHEAERFLRDNACAIDWVTLPVGGSDADLDEEALAKALVQADAWIVGHARVTRGLLKRLPRLRAVCRRGVGYDRVDTAAIRDLGKVATIAVGGNEAAVADHVIGLMLAVARRHRECQLRMSRDDWSIPIGGDLYRKTVGVVGLGRIGRGVVRRLAGFDCHILAVAPNADAAEWSARGVQLATLDEVLSRSDYLTLHLPLNESTRGLIDRGALARMRTGAVLINTARGGLVDDAALLDALQAQRLGGAGLDVFASESDPKLEATTRALLSEPSVVATPHAAGSTVESLARTNLVAAQCAVGVLRGQSLAPGTVVADGR